MVNTTHLLTPTKNPAQRPQGGDLFLFTHLLVEVSVFIYLSALAPRKAVPPSHVLQGPRPQSVLSQTADPDTRERVVCASQRTVWSVTARGVELWRRLRTLTWRPGERTPARAHASLGTKRYSVTLTCRCVCVCVRVRVCVCVCVCVCCLLYTSPSPRD